MTGAPIFLYGTLLDGRRLARCSGDATLVLRSVPAILLGFRRVSLRGTAYPTLRRDAGAALAGELIRPCAAALRRLDAYEGGAYKLCPVRVLTARGPRKARAWLAAAWRADARPWPAYRRTTFAGVTATARSG